MFVKSTCKFNLNFPKPLMMDVHKNKCLSCGKTKNMGRRRYCSVACRQRLHYQLDIRTGLLRALNTRYATFYFTETEIILDVISSDSEGVYSFVFSRKPGNFPVQDFIQMSNYLGDVWWSERRKTERRYLANRFVLNSAKKNRTPHYRIFPMESLTPTLVGDSLMCLKLNKSDLQTPEAVQRIKSAFRNMAKKHHPDQGGDPNNFRKIHSAYQQLLNWAENPSFIRRRGFNDKWFYDGYRNKWLQPTPVKD